MTVDEMAVDEKGLPVVEHLLLNGKLIGSGIWLHEGRCQRKDIITDEVMTDFADRVWNIQRTIIQGLF